MRVTNVILYLWVLVTLSISAMDLALGVIFGIDYNRFSTQADKQGFMVNPAMTIFISAQVVSMSMMVIAFKGFILWIINIAFVCYLFTETFLINKAVTSANVSLERSWELRSIFLIRNSIHRPHISTELTKIQMVPWNLLWKGRMISLLFKLLKLSKNFK